MPTMRAVPSSISRRELAPLAAPQLGRAAAQAPAIVTADAMRVDVPYGVQVGDVIGRPRDRLEQGRPGGADAGALGHHREHGRRRGGADRRCARGPRLHRPRSTSPACRPGSAIFYEVSFLDLADLKSRSEPVRGSFVTPPASERDVRFVWSGDTVGPGLGHQSRPGRHADLRGDARRSSPTSSSIPATRSTPTDRSMPRPGRRRQDLARAGRQALAQRHHPREGEGRRDPARVPDELRLQSDG